MSAWTWVFIGVTAAALAGCVWCLLDIRRSVRRAEAAAVESKAAADRAVAARARISLRVDAARFNEGLRRAQAGD